MDGTGRRYNAQCLCPDPHDCQKSVAHHGQISTDNWIKCAVCPLVNTTLRDYNQPALYMFAEMSRVRKHWRRERTEWRSVCYLNHSGAYPSFGETTQDESVKSPHGGHVAIPNCNCQQLSFFKGSRIVAFHHMRGVSLIERGKKLAMRARAKHFVLLLLLK